MRIYVGRDWMWREQYHSETLSHIQSGKALTLAKWFL